MTRAPYICQDMLSLIASTKYTRVNLKINVDNVAVCFIFSTTGMLNTLVYAKNIYYIVIRRRIFCRNDARSSLKHDVKIHTVCHNTPMYLIYVHVLP